VDGWALPAAAFSGFAAHWMSLHVETECKPSVVRRYESIIRVHLLPFFGDQQIATIDWHRVTEFKAANARAISPETGRPLSRKTVNEHIAVLSSMFERAVEWRYLRMNPCRGVRRLKVPPTTFKFYVRQQSEAFLAAALRVEPKWYAFFLVGFRTGLRLGEIIALEWGDLDLVTGQLHVRRSRTRNKTTPPKGGRERIVEMSPAVVAALKEHRHLNGDLVFPQADGSHVTRDIVKHPYGRVIRAAALPAIRIHDMRHSFASQLVIAGVPLKAVQELLGHTDIKMTMRYAHLAPGAKTDYVRVLDEPAPTSEPQRQRTLS
jgi:integrase